MADSNLSIISARGLLGYAYGFRMPSLLIECETDYAPRSGAVHIFSEVINVLINLGGDISQPYTQREKELSLPEEILLVTFLLQRAARIAIREQGKIFLRQSANRIILRLAIPSPAPGHRTIFEFVSWYLQLQKVENSHNLLGTIEEKLREYVAFLGKSTLAGSNVPHFLLAASELNIPVTEIVGQTLQFGQCHKARWLNSSFTDKTSHLATTIAKNKSWTSKFLYDSGFPVAPHAIVKSIDQALKLADKIGYPVVIKPADLDRGIGVSAGLRTPEEIEEAFNLALKHSSMVMLEKHIFGRDYRLTVFNGELLWAIERIPAGVTGDGKSTVIQLLHVLNSDPKRGDGKHNKGMQKILLDSEALSLLRTSGKTAEYIPKQGEFVPLRRRANISAGGTPVSVMGQVHRDNERLVVRAVETLGLDIAGVDLITPDVSQSWQEVGAAICEINAQPQLGSVTSSHVYKEILSRLIDGDGRVPVTLILDFQGKDFLANAVKRYSQQGLSVGYSTNNAVFINNECISSEPTPTYKAGQILIRDRRVQAIVLHVQDDSLLKTGLPFDYIDTFIGFDLPIDPNNRTTPFMTDQQLEELILMIQIT
jgi:cyanophycin synthetase